MFFHGHPAFAPTGPDSRRQRSVEIVLTVDVWLDRLRHPAGTMIRRPPHVADALVRAGKARYPETLSPSPAGDEDRAAVTRPEPPSKPARPDNGDIPPGESRADTNTPRKAERAPDARTGARSAADTTKRRRKKTTDDGDCE